ncbi:MULTISPECIES: hypothetical protein [Paenibacillus]|uniref:hypothetical protein n=1 Tax=Paenibacillus TaxID=44249 RepID=UPI000FDC6870|nr:MULTISPECIES: hypothetical protein [Paenibacillus]QGG58118.1 hypothetical protein GE073_22755 [Paenibacillus sp. B01]
MKKLKLLALSVGLATLSFAGSASATPGFADDGYSAHFLPPNQFFSGKITSYGDEDWFQWFNYTGSPVNLTVFLANGNGDGTPSKNFDFDFRIYSPNNTPVSPLDNGAGNIDTMSVTGLPPGYTIYWNVKGHSPNDYSSTQEYLTWLSIN